MPVDFNAHPNFVDNGLNYDCYYFENCHFSAGTQYSRVTLIKICYRAAGENLRFFEVKITENWSMLFES